MFAELRHPDARRSGGCRWRTPRSGAALLALLRCALPSGTADDVLAYLRTPGFLRVPALADRLEFEPGARARSASTRPRALWEGDRAVAARRDRARARGRGGRARRPLLALLADEARRLFERPHLGAAHTLDRDELVDARVLRELRRALDELIELEARDALGAPEPAELHDLLGDLEVVPRRSGAPGGAVQIANPRQIRARRYRAVLVLGLQEGEFPDARRGPSRSCRTRSAAR